MSRIAKKPISIPKGVLVQIEEQMIVVKSGSNQVAHVLPANVSVVIENNQLQVAFDENSKSFAGTLRANLFNTIHGFEKGFEIKLVLVGVGYKAALQGTTLVLNLGYSNPINYQTPVGIKLEIPSQTEVVIKGENKQLVGQIAAKIRSFRPPEPYKGKGIKYSDEVIILKETKKK